MGFYSLWPLQQSQNFVNANFSIFPEPCQVVRRPNLSHYATVLSATKAGRAFESIRHDDDIQVAVFEGLARSARAKENHLLGLKFLHKLRQDCCLELGYPIIDVRSHCIALRAASTLPRLARRGKQLAFEDGIGTGLLSLHQLGLDPLGYQGYYFLSQTYRMLSHSFSINLCRDAVW